MPVPGLVTPERPPRPVRPDRGKLALDVAAAAVLLVLLAPVMAIVALLVAAGLGRPVLFRQCRAGRHGEPFELVKFRTMRPLDPRRGLVGDADRLTPLGRWLRSTSLDELPTLWNVLRGDMSLVATVRTVLRREGISAAGVATAPEFLGTPAGPTHAATPRFAEAGASSSVPHQPAVTVRQGGRR